MSKEKINFIFTKSDVDTYHSGQRYHTYYYYKFLKEYECVINSNYELPVDYIISFYDTFENIKLENDRLNIIFFSMNWPYWNSFKDSKTINFLQDLDEVNSNVKLVLDYNNEALLPGNFSKEFHLNANPIIENINFEQFTLSTLGYNRQNLKDKEGFKSIVSNLSYIGFWFFTLLLESDWVKKKDLICTWPNKKYNSRYFCPNNMYRPAKAQCILSMYDKDMLYNTEWNMNKNLIEDMNIYGQEELEHTQRYHKLFGITPRHFSYPWKYNFSNQFLVSDDNRQKHQLSQQTIYNEDYQHHGFDHTLLEHCYIYIANETFNNINHHGEGPIDPSKPYSYVEITEKVFKGFLYGMPMFVNGTAGTLQAARDFGFDTFDDLSKHDYDSEIDNSKRLNDMLDSAQNFPEPNKEIVERLKENKNRFLQKEFLWDLQSKFIENILTNT